MLRRHTPSLFPSILWFFCERVAVICNAAIATARHVPVDEIEEGGAGQEATWADMGEYKMGIGHCGFSMNMIERPEDGKMHG